MSAQPEVRQMIAEMTERMKQIFPEGLNSVVLFGSYARNDAEEGSDIDVMYLVGVPRSVISSRSWQVGAAAADLLLKHGVVISPVVENRDYFEKNAELLPFFRNVRREGVGINA